MNKRAGEVVKPTPERVSTGIVGLDEILHGGYIGGRTYLLSGPPGGGKTTIGWHFLCAGVAAGESVLFITFGESQSELLENAASSGFDISRVHLCDLSPSSDLFENIRAYDIFPAAEVELEPTTARLIEAVNTTRPKRVFVDSITALRYLSSDALQFRRQTLSFLRYIKERGGCVLMTSESSIEAPDGDLRFLCDGVIELAPSARARSLTVVKFRGSDFAAGEHTLRLTASGAAVFPRLIPDSYGTTYPPGMLRWGIGELNELTHGGLERGSITLISGPSGVGKTTVGTLFMKEAAARGTRAVIYTFDERATTLVERSESVEIPVLDLMQRGMLDVVAVEALRYTPDEFASMVRSDVENNGTQVVMIDSISGYRLSVLEENLNERLHALCRYLQNVGVTVLLVNELLEIAEFRVSDVGITYIADNVMILRYIERSAGVHAEVGRAIGVLKKRSSDFEKTLRAFEVTRSGVVIGEPITSLGGIFGFAHDQREISVV